MHRAAGFLDNRSKRFLSSLKQTVFSKPSHVVVAIALAFCLSASQVLGLWLDGETFSMCFWAFWGLSFLIFVIISLAAHLVISFQYEANGEHPSVSRKAWGIVFAVLLTSFTITFLLNFPGTYSNDSLDSINIALGNAPLTNAHPVLYTAFVTAFVQVGVALDNLVAGLVLYCIVQMILCASVLSYACCWLKKMGAPNLAVLASIAFFAWNPIIARYSFTMWKDIPFSLCVVLVVLLLLELALTQTRFLTSKRRCFALALLVLVSCLLRNNALYAMALTVLCLAIAYRHHLKPLLPTIIAVPVAFAITGPLYTAVGIEPSPFRESVGIPIQQIAATFADGGSVDSDEEALLSNLMDLDAMAENYTPESSNPVKYHESFNDEWLNTHKGEFLATWMAIGMKNPKIYLRAWLWETRGYWDIQTQDYIVVGPTGFDDDGRNLIYEATGFPLAQGESSSQYFNLRKATIASPLFSLAFSVWFAIGIIVLRLITAQRRAAIPLAPFIGLWLTLLIAAPYYCEFRYLYPLHLVLPIMMVTLFLKPNDGGEIVEERK